MAITEDFTKNGKIKRFALAAFSLNAHSHLTIRR